MRRILLLLVLLQTVIDVFSQSEHSNTVEDLLNTRDQVSLYDQKKQAVIDSIKNSGRSIANSSGRFQISLQLYEQYKSFKYDSAYGYARQMQETARILGDQEKISQARLKLIFSLLSAGLFKEADDSLMVMNIAGLPVSQKEEYYFLMGRLKYDLADFNSDIYYSPLYRKIGNEYIDSAIRLSDPASFDYAYINGLRDMLGGNREQAQDIFTTILQKPGLSPHEIALTASTLSDIYIKNNQIDSAIKLLACAAMADIQSSTKETSAAYNLASLLYRKGDVKNASACIALAIADAAFYGARQRKVKMSDILPLIESEKLNLVEKQKTTLVFYLVIATVLLLGVIGLIIVVLKQVKKLQQAKKEITEAHLRDQEINHQLSELNARLSEANKIKEEYIGYFFSVNTEFFDKIDKFRNSVEQKVVERKLEEIRFLVNNFNLRAEKEHHLQSFDRVFLKLFPNFVSEFNQLFNKDNQIQLREGELLNTDMRIFALIRMGIHDNEKIARILQYSVHTINTYKTKIKNRSLVANEEFEQKIMAIKSV